MSSMSGDSPLRIVTWKWGAAPFGARHVNTLRAMLDRHVHLDHELVCLTDDPTGLDGDIVTMPITQLQHTPRCRRRMVQFSRDFTEIAGRRFLAIDLDVVIVDDLTPIVSRTEPIVCWKVAHAGVYSGSFLLMDTGVLHGLWERFARDVEGYPRSVQPHGIPSDQAMLNHYLTGQRIPYWTEADGFVTYFGKGYERLEHFGVGPTRPTLPKGARIVVLGSADVDVLHEGRFGWVREHWHQGSVAA